jgi:hypothetical protein
MPAALTVIYPDGEIEYRLTDRELEVGDVLARNGRTWFVAEITREADGAVTVRLRAETGPDGGDV